MILNFGITVLTALIAALMLFLLYLSLYTWIRVLREARTLERKKAISQLEATAGIPLLEDGECPKCGAKLVAGAKFCSNCGRSIMPEARLCERCGTRNQESASYCYECGQKLTP